MHTTQDLIETLNVGVVTIAKINSDDSEIPEFITAVTFKLEI